MRRSRTLEKLRKGEYITMVQSWSIPHWKIVDIMGFVGFDAVWIEHEHSDFSYGEMSQMILAARSHDMDSVIRVERTGYNDIIKPLEAGATGLVIPHCMGGEDARSIVREAKFSLSSDSAPGNYPLGMRGSGGSTDSDYGMTDRMEYLRHANSETFIAGIIEDKEAVDDVDAIAATEGIDILLMGPGDLSQSYGIIGQMQHELIERATDKVAEACAKHGKWWGTPVGSREAAEKAIKRGARIMQSDNEQSLIASGFKRVKEMYADLEV